MRITRSPRGWVLSETKNPSDESLEEVAFRSGFRVKEVCHELRVSEQHLRRIFLRDVGISVKDWLRCERMVRARRMLVAGQTTETIADLLGFSHPNSFRRAFRDVYGVTPAEYLASEARRAIGWTGLSLRDSAWG